VAVAARVVVSRLNALGIRSLLKKILTRLKIIEKEEAMAVIDTSALAAAIDSAVAELAKAATELADSAAKDATIAGLNSDLSASQTAVNDLTAKLAAALTPAA